MPYSLRLSKKTIADMYEVAKRHDKKMATYAAECLKRMTAEELGRIRRLEPPKK